MLLCDGYSRFQAGFAKVRINRPFVAKNRFMDAMLCDKALILAMRLYGPFKI